MQVTPTPTTSGAAIQRYKIGYHADEWGQRSSTPSGIPDASGSWVRYADHVTALAAGQATAAQAGVPANMRLCYLCGHPADAHPWVNDPRGGKRRGDCPAAPAQPAAQQGVAYAALHDEREMLKHALWLASSFTVHRYMMSNAEGRWSGAEKVLWHDELCRLYVAVFRGVEVDRVRVDFEEDWVAVHDATQELTDHMDVVIGFPLKGVPDYEALAPKFFAYFHRLATHALRASHGQASSQAGEYPALVCDYCGALTPDPWHSSGMLHGKMSKHIHSCDACAARGQAPADAKALAEADRRAGEAERLLATCKEDVMRFEQVRSRMKYQWGAEQRVSFDEVWDEALALKKAAQAAPQAADSVTAPAPPPECETEAEKRAFAFGWFKALESERMKADNKKKDPL